MKLEIFHPNHNQKPMWPFFLWSFRLVVFFGTQGMELLSTGDVERSFGLHKSASQVIHHQSYFPCLCCNFCNHLKSSTHNVSPSSIHPSIHTTALPERTMASSTGQCWIIIILFRKFHVQNRIFHDIWKDWILFFKSHNFVFEKNGLVFLLITMVLCSFWSLWSWCSFRSSSWSCILHILCGLVFV
jgi:hypothetical protein